jgi:hypothetical protein
MSQLLQKPFTCFGCNKQVKLQRSDDNTKWLKFEEDGVTVHQCDKKQKAILRRQQQEQRDAVIRDELAEVKAQLKLVLTQLQMLREEVKAKR